MRRFERPATSSFLQTAFERSPREEREIPLERKYRHKAHGLPLDELFTAESSDKGLSL